MTNYQRNHNPTPRGAASAPGAASFCPQPDISPDSATPWPGLFSHKPVHNRTIEHFFLLRMLENARILPPFPIFPQVSFRSLPIRPLQHLVITVKSKQACPGCRYTAAGRSAKPQQIHNRQLFVLSGEESFDRGRGGLVTYRPIPDRGRQIAPLGLFSATIKMAGSLGGGR